MAAQREWFEKDYYKVLGVAESATDKEITRAYRKLAKEHHPDANPGSEERFKEISHAHDVLSDAEKRREYDAEQQMLRMGGGFGGCTINIVREAFVEEVVEKFRKRYLEGTGIALDHYDLVTGNGASEEQA